MNDFNLTTSQQVTAIVKHCQRNNDKIGSIEIFNGYVYVYMAHKQNAYCTIDTVTDYKRTPNKQKKYYPVS